MCGGGARLPAVAARAARAGLSGIEFGVNIPGTVGGAVRMNANAYGGELERVLEWVEIATAAGCERRAPARARPRLPPLEPGAGEIVARASLRSSRRGPDTVKATLAEMRAPPPRGPAAGDQDVRLDLQEPRGPARGGAQRGAAAGRGRLQRPGGRRRALRAQARQLHREHRRREHRRRARGDGRGPPPRAASASASSSSPRCRRSATCAFPGGSGVRPPRSKTVRWIAPFAARSVDRSCAAPSRAGRPRGRREPARCVRAGPVAARGRVGGLRALRCVVSRHRRVRIALLVAAASRCRCSPAGWLWLRNSSLVSVEHVRSAACTGRRRRRSKPR